MNKLVKLTVVILLCIFGIHFDETRAESATLLYRKTTLVSTSDSTHIHRGGTSEKIVVRGGVAPGNVIVRGQKTQDTTLVRKGKAPKHRGKKIQNNTLVPNSAATDSTLVLPQKVQESLGRITPDSTGKIQESRNKNTPDSSLVHNATDSGRVVVRGGIVPKPLVNPEIQSVVLQKEGKQCPWFKDTMRISKVTMLSLIAPGFAQLYNRQYWKIPVLYASVGTFAWLGLKSNSKYKQTQKAYNAAVYNKLPQAETERLQARSYRYKTQRTLLLGGALLSYLYFIGDGTLNYPNHASPVKKATTLSMIIPGAGQIYNRSYWKVPIVVGGFATMGYIIDYNNRGYKRFQKAYNEFTDDDPSTVDEFKGRYPAQTLKNMRDAYRRNRDLSIIITCGFYLLNIVDAHVEAHLKDYDISDDLAVTLEPAVLDINTLRASTNRGFGLSLKINF